MYIFQKPNPIIFGYTFGVEKAKTKPNNCFTIDFRPKIINMARKTLKK